MEALNFLHQYASGRKVFLLFVVTNFVYLIMLLYSMPAVMKQAPEMRPFDLSPSGYSQEYAKNLLTAIGPEGRSAYARIQLPFDFVYPGLFALTYTMMLVWILGKSYDAGSKIFLLTLFPVGAGFFDYMENVGIIVMLRSYPELGAATVSITSVCSILKSSLTVVFYLLLLYSIIVFIIRRLSRRRQGLV